MTPENPESPTDKPTFVVEDGRQPQPGDEPIPDQPMKKAIGTIEDHTVNPAVLHDGLTIEQSHANAKAIFPQTVQRITTLMQTLIQLTGNGDLPLWAVIEAIGNTVRGLNFAAAPHQSRLEFLTLAELILAAYAKRMADYRQAWEDYEIAFAITTKAGTTAPDLPTLPVWTDADTTAIYAQIDATFGRKAEAPNA